MILFKDIAHLYIGCKLQVESPIKDTFVGELTPTHYATFVSHNGTIMGAKVKPILLPLSAMTDEQCNEWFGYVVNESDSSFRRILDFDMGDSLVWSRLLSEHFDLFNLIENGEAIDATTLEVNPYK